MEYQSRFAFQRQWHAVVKHAEIAPVKVHDLRRTGITRALLSGMAPVSVQKMAGHADIKTTMRYYVEVSKADLRKAVEKLQRVVG